MAESGPIRTLGGRYRWSLSDDSTLAYTASATRVTGTPRVSEEMPVQRPVPFWPAVSRIFSTQRLAVLVAHRHDVGGDIDEIGVERALLPAPEGVGHLVVGHAEPDVHERVGLGQHLHVAVLDAVVDHLHVVAGTVAAHPVAARGAVGDLGGNRLQNVLHRRPGGAPIRPA